LGNSTGGNGGWGVSVEHRKEKGNFEKESFREIVDREWDAKGEGPGASRRQLDQN